MSQRRMFSTDIVNSDAFLEMPASTQALYFHLAMRADDDGFVTPKMTMRLIGSNDDELKVLIAKRFVLSFESGVVVIKHWLIHNLIRADLYKETLYKKEKLKLGLNENGAYTELREGVSELKQIDAPKWLKQRRNDARTANVPQTAPRLGKDRLGKDSKEATNKGRFTPPSVQQVAEYCSTRENNVSAQEFVDYYNSVGWVIGKSRKPMKDWKASIHNVWEKKAEKFANDVPSFLNLLGKASAKDPALTFKDYDLFQVANEYSFSLQENYTPSEKSHAAFADKDLWTYLKAKL